MEEANKGAASPARLALYMTSWCRFCANVVSAADRLGSEIGLRDIDVNSAWREGARRFRVCGSKTRRAR